MRWRWGRMVAGATVAMLACGGPAGLRHRVQRGESLYRIGLAYGIAHDELARANDLRDPDRLEVGQVIVIPRARRPVPVAVVTPERARADRPTPPELPTGSGAFQWPVGEGLVTSGFGPRGETHHDGIDIGAPEGSAVRAARAGRVLYADRLRGYGNLIIVEHADGYATVYAHNRRNRARPGETVRQGQTIADLGQTGKTSGPNLHFEVRKDNVARNPLFYLPTAVAAGESQRRADVVESGR